MGIAPGSGGATAGDCKGAISVWDDSVVGAITDAPGVIGFPVAMFVPGANDCGAGAGTGGGDTLVGNGSTLGCCGTAGVGAADGLAPPPTGFDAAGAVRGCWALFISGLSPLPDIKLVGTVSFDAYFATMRVATFARRK
jgi:hypothetical protein